MHQTPPRSALRLTAIGLALAALVGVFRAIQFHRLWRSIDSDPDEVSNIVQLLEWAGGGLLLAALVTGTGLILLARQRETLARVLVGVGLLFCAIRLLSGLFGFLPEDSVLRALVVGLPWYVYWGIHMVFMGASLAYFRQLDVFRTRGMRAAGVAVLTLASASLVWTGLLRLEVIEADAMGRQFPLIGMALGHSAELALAALFGLAQPAGEATTGPVHSSVAAAGLLQFRSALLARLYLMMMMVGFTVLAALARNGKMVQFALLGGTIVAMLIGVYMVFGLARFASNAAGADAALGAAALLTLGVLIDGWMLSVVYDVMEGGYARARAAQANLMGGQTVSQLVGVSAVLALLSGLKGAARAIDEGLLADQAGGLMAMVALLFVVALGMRFAIEKVGGAGAVFIGIGALIFALVVLFKLVGLLRRLAEALEATPDRAVTDEGVFD